MAKIVRRVSFFDVAKTLLDCVFSPWVKTDIPAAIQDPGYAMFAFRASGAERSQNTSFKDQS
jgi:hypothetical protein